MKIKHIRNTHAARWAETNGYSVHRAMIYRHKLKRHIRFGCLEKEPQDTFLTCLSKPYYYYAIYYRQNGEWLLYGINDHFAFWSQDEVAEFANEQAIPFHLLDENFAKEHNVPTTAIQLLRMKKQRTK